MPAHASIPYGWLPAPRTGTACSSRERADRRYSRSGQSHRHRSECAGLWANLSMRALFASGLFMGLRCRGVGLTRGCPGALDHCPVRAGEGRDRQAGERQCNENLHESHIWNVEGADVRRDCGARSGCEPPTDVHSCYCVSTCPTGRKASGRFDALGWPWSFTVQPPPSARYSDTLAANWRR